jgi:hypothetical protein
MGHLDTGHTNPYALLVAWLGTARPGSCSGESMLRSKSVEASSLLVESAVATAGIRCRGDIKPQDTSEIGEEGGPVGDVLSVRHGKGVPIASWKNFE